MRLHRSGFCCRSISRVSQHLVSRCSHVIAQQRVEWGSLGELVPGGDGLEQKGAGPAVGERPGLSAIAWKTHRRFWVRSKDTAGLILKCFYATMSYRDRCVPAAFQMPPCQGRGLKFSFRSPFMWHLWARDWAELQNAADRWKETWMRSSLGRQGCVK